MHDVFQAQSAHIVDSGRVKNDANTVQKHRVAYTPYAYTRMNTIAVLWQS
jgi:hypothetical protein